MKKLILATMVFFNSISAYSSESGLCSNYKDSLRAIFDSLEIVERSGCCSWHGGVCGCSASGRTICCDGKLSPSCRCD
jgi:hypothetical protein